jgi:hypothetical protein
MKLSSLLDDSHTKNITPYVDTDGTFLPKTGEICLPLIKGETDILDDLNFTYFRYVKKDGFTGIFLRLMELQNKGYCVKQSSIIKSTV